MQKFIFFCLALLVISAWNWETHPAFVETIYYSLDDTARDSFNLTALQEGSLAPDKDFHDNRYHHYPPSYNLTLYWLQKARNAYRQGLFNEASYAFGVASHYVSDSFAAPHNIEKESSRDHGFYENQGSAQYRVVLCPEAFHLVEINRTLSDATATGKTWQSWLQTKETTYPETAVAAAMDPLYHLFWQTFNVTCLRKETNYTSGSWLPQQPLTILLVGVTLYFLLSTLITLFSIQKEV